MGTLQQKLTLLFATLGLVQLPQLFNQWVLGAGDGSNLTGQWVHLPEWVWAKELRIKPIFPQLGGRKNLLRRRLGPIFSSADSLLPNGKIPLGIGGSFPWFKYPVNGPVFH